MLAGIPAYRLPREVLAGEIKRITDMGIEIKYNHKTTDVLAEKAAGNFDAVFLAIGAHLGKNIAIPIKNPCKIFDAVDYLRLLSLHQNPKPSKHLAIYGGGNTAIDVARSAKRLGVPEITIIYHRTQNKMSAFENEIKEALEENIKFIFLRSIVGLKENTLSLSINELDEKGRSKHTGSFESLEIDTLVFALSQIPDSEFLREVPNIEVQPNGVVTVDEYYMTGHEGIFAGGDMIPYDRSVTIAVGQGKQAARHINAYLNDTVFNSPPRHELALFDKLHITLQKSPLTELQNLDPKNQIKIF